MKQNYNSPVFIMEAADNNLPSEEMFSAAFKAAYPTYKEARLFVLSGGDCIYKEPYPSGNAAFRYSKFEAGLLDNVTYGTVVLVLGSNTRMVEYASSSGDQGDGGEAG